MVAGIWTDGEIESLLVVRLQHKTLMCGRHAQCSTPAQCVEQKGGNGQPYYLCGGIFITENGIDLTLGSLLKTIHIWPNSTGYHASFNFFEKCNLCVNHAEIIIWDDLLVTLLFCCYYYYIVILSLGLTLCPWLAYNSLWRPGWPSDLLRSACLFPIAKRKGVPPHLALHTLLIHSIALKLWFKQKYTQL